MSHYKEPDGYDYVTEVPTAQYVNIMAVIEAARTVVKDSVLACSWVREADFEAGARCDCPSCTAAQSLVDALAKVSE